VAKSNPIDLAGEIVASFVSNNSIPRSELPGLIEAVHAAVKTIAEGAEVAAAVLDPPEPAVSIRKSVTPDFLICLEDGKKFKSLRRHLTGLGMTPEQYREKWNLPSNYPMVAPNYAAQRSTLAKNIGLGQARGRQLAAAPSSVELIETVAPVPANEIAVDTKTPDPARVETIEVVAPKPESVVKSEAVAGPPASSETTNDGAIETESSKPDSPPKRKTKSKGNAPEAPSVDTVAPKRGRPRNATA
jgi:predicted transcriptional regulator